MENYSKIAWFDMDGSLFDYDGHMKCSLETLRSPHEPAIGSDLHGLEKTDWLKARIDLIKSIPGWWRSMPPMRNGFRLWSITKEMGFDNRILTKGPRSKSIAWMEKLDCVTDHLGDDVQVSIVGSKGETYGRFLYDDFPDYMDAWLKHRPRGLGIMPVNENNKDYTHPNVIRYHGEVNLAEVVCALEICKNRKTGEPLDLSGIRS